MNVFDIIGPVMIGPSSSHTAGAVRLFREQQATILIWGEDFVFCSLLMPIRCIRYFYCNHLMYDCQAKYRIMCDIFYEIIKSGDEYGT